MQKREDKDGSRMEKRICETVSDHNLGLTDYAAFFFDFLLVFPPKYTCGL